MVRDEFGDAIRLKHTELTLCVTLGNPAERVVTVRLRKIKITPPFQKKTHTECCRAGRVAADKVLRNITDFVEVAGKKRNQLGKRVHGSILDSAFACNRFTFLCAPIIIPRLSVPNFSSASPLFSSVSSFQRLKHSMAAARAAFSRIAPAIANVRARPSPALRRAALARGYATASENSVRIARHSHATCHSEVIHSSPR